MPVDDEGAANGVGGVLLVVTETTETILAREALHESEQRLRVANDAANIGTWDYNLITRTGTWGPRAKELFGVAPEEELTYQRFIELVHPDDRERVAAAIQSLLADVRRYDIEYRIIKPHSGLERWIRAVGQPLFEGGQATRLIGVVFDITQDKLARWRIDIINAAAAAVAAKLDVSEIAQIVTDAGAELVGARLGAFLQDAQPEGEARCVAISGAPRSELAGFPFIPPHQLAAKLPSRPSGRGSSSLRSDDVLRDARFRDLDLGQEGVRPTIRSYLATAVVARSGMVHGWMEFGHPEPGAFTPEHEGVLLDLAQHAATAIDNSALVHALQSLNANLEERVSSEVSERLEAEEQLRQAQQLEAVGQLTGGVAHDFNNLLTVISAGVNMLQRSDEEHAEALRERMLEAVKRGATLTDQLLALSRKRETKPEVVSLGEHLRGMSSLLSRGLGGGLRVEIDAPDDVAPVYVDPTGLQLAILNLTVNARDASPGGGVITIRVRNGTPEDPHTPYVSLSVIDKGVGMDEATKARMFDAFFTTKEVGKGTGLGLPQVKGLALQSGGRVEVESAPGKGTTVTLVLPKSKTMAPPAEPPPAKTGPAPVGGEMAAQEAGRALLVEDDDDVAAMTSSMLEQLGWSVRRVSCAEAAVNALTEDEGVNLVFSDFIMPGPMNGLDLAGEIRAKRPGLPIVLTSGFSLAARRAADAAKLPLLAKPFTLETLAAAVGLARRQAADEARQRNAP
jgi:PAS domain S-box-containing protein